MTFAYFRCFFKVYNVIKVGWVVEKKQFSGKFTKDQKSPQCREIYEFLL